MRVQKTSKPQINYEGPLYLFWKQFHAKKNIGIFIHHGKFERQVQVNNNNNNNNNNNYYLLISSAQVSTIRFSNARYILDRDKHDVYNTLYWQLPTRGFSVTIYRKSNRHNSNHYLQLFSTNQIKCWFLVRGENRSTLGKTSHSRGENQQTQEKDSEKRFRKRCARKKDARSLTRSSHENDN